jgi:hypothetical protein
MPEPPVARQPRRDDTAADTSSLVRLGREDPPPVPEPAIQPFQEPAYPGGDWTDGTDVA